MTRITSYKEHMLSNTVTKFYTRAEVIEFMKKAIDEAFYYGDRSDKYLELLIP